MNLESNAVQAHHTKATLLHFSFLNKPIIKKHLQSFPNDSFVMIDATRADFIDKDIIEEINDFIDGARDEISKEKNKSLQYVLVVAYMLSIKKKAEGKAITPEDIEYIKNAKLLWSISKA